MLSYPMMHQGRHKHGCAFLKTDKRVHSLHPAQQHRMHYLIELAESSGWSDTAWIQYFNQSPRTRANLGRSLTFEICSQTGLDEVNGERTYLLG